MKASPRPATPAVMAPKIPRAGTARALPSPAKLAAALLVAALLALLVAETGPPLGTQAAALLNVWLLFAWIAPLWAVLSPPPPAPAPQPPAHPAEPLAQVFLVMALWRVPGVYLLSRFLGAPFGLASSLAIGVALSAVELLGTVAAGLASKGKPRRAWLVAYLILFFGAGLGSALWTNLLPAHWVAGTLHLLSGPQWTLFPPAGALAALVNHRGEVALSLLCAGVLGGLGAALFRLSQAPSRSRAAVFAVSLGLCLVPGAVRDPERAEYLAGQRAANAPPRGIVGRQAPELVASQYTGETPPRLSDHPGQVRALFFFQSYCPGCVSWGFPTTRAVEDEFFDRGLTTFYLQTTFDLEQYNTFEAAREEVASWSAPWPARSGRRPRRRAPHHAQLSRRGHPLDDPDRSARRGAV